MGEHDQLQNRQAICLQSIDFGNKLAVGVDFGRAPSIIYD
jgi:hypothetical protein